MLQKVKDFQTMEGVLDLRIPEESLESFEGL